MLSNAVRRKFLRATIGGALALSLTLPAGIVIADELDDRKVDVEKNIDNLEQDMEVLDSDIVATDKKLRAQQVSGSSCRGSSRRCPKPCLQCTSYCRGSNEPADQRSSHEGQGC